MLRPADLTSDCLWANAYVSTDTIAVEEEEDKLVIRYDQVVVCHDTFLFQEGEHVSCHQSGEQVW